MNLPDDKLTCEKCEKPAEKTRLENIFYCPNCDEIKSLNEVFWDLSTEEDTGYPGDDASPEPPNADYWSEG